MEHHQIAFPVVAPVALLRPGHAEADQALDAERLPPQHSLIRQCVPDGPVDLLPQRMGRRDQQGVVAGRGVERQPGPSRSLAELFVRHLVHAAAEQRHRLAGIACQNRLHRRPQLRGPLALDVLHRRRRHPRPL